MDVLERVFSGQFDLPEAMVQIEQMKDIATEQKSALLGFERDPTCCHRSLLLRMVSPDAEVIDLYA